MYAVFSFSGRLQEHELPSAVGTFIVGLAAAAFLFFRAKRLHWSRAWLLLSASVALVQLVGMSYFVYAVISGRAIAASALFAMYLVSYPPLFAGVLALSREDRPLRASSRLNRVGGWLDSAIVLFGGGMAIVFMGLIPVARANRGDTIALIFVACNVLMTLILLLSSTRYALLQGRTFRPFVKIFLIVGVIGSMASVVIVLAEEAGAGYVIGDSADGVYVIAMAALAWAGYISPVRRLEDDVPVRWLGMPIKNLLPLFATLLGLGLLVGHSFRDAHEDTGAMVVSVVILVLIVIARQLVASIETGQMEARKAVTRIEKRFRSLVTNSSDVIVVTDTDMRISFATPSAERLFGAKGGGGVGAKLTDVLAPEAHTSALAAVAECLERPLARVEGEWLVRDIDGSWSHFHVIIRNLLDDPTVGGLVYTMRDVEDRVRFESQLERQVFYDPLTQLPNRVLFSDRLRHALARARRTGTLIAVMFADLDDFKLVNDTGGHILGDKLLVQVALRLQTTLRASDTPARLSGDEFAVLIEDLTDLLQATHVAEELLECLRPPFSIGESELTVGASIGLVCSDGDHSPEELLRHADTAMYEAKRAGGNRFDVFEPSMQEAIHRRLELQADLRRGTAEREFVVFYQPVVEMATERVAGLEALVRWRHPASGLLGPADFLDVAEQTGLVSTLGQQVLEEACRQTKIWTDAFVPGWPLSVAVNFSPRQLREPSVVDMIAEALDSSGLDPHQLVLEVTEDALIEGEQPTSTKLWALKKLGVRLAIDDFGTGYSSLSRLSSFPFDYVKIDKQFVGRLASSRQESAVARSIIGLAQSLGLHAVAEGIEREEQRDRLVSLGCKYGQGFLFSEPLATHDMSDYLLATLALEVR